MSKKAQFFFSFYKYIEYYAKQSYNTTIKILTQKAPWYFISHLVCCWMLSLSEQNTRKLLLFFFQTILKKVIFGSLWFLFLNYVFESWIKMFSVFYILCILYFQNTHMIWLCLICKLILIQVWWILEQALTKKSFIFWTVLFTSYCCKKNKPYFKKVSYYLLWFLLAG